MDLAAVLTRQDGLITKQQALAAGMSLGAIRHATRPGGPWERLAPGLYAAFTGQLSTRQRLRAAVMRAGPDAVLTGSDACRAHGLRYVPDAPRPMVLIPHGRRAPVGGVAIVRRAVDVPRPRVVAGLPVAPVDRAVMDATRWSASSPQVRPSLQDTRALVCESVQRRLTTPDRLAQALLRMPRNGTRFIRTAVDDVAAGCWSAPECELRDVVRSSSVLPEPHWNTPLPDLPDVTPDGWWDEARLALEVDSEEFHDYGLGPEQTERRQARMVAAGWTVMSISPRRIRRSASSLLVEIESSYRLHLRRH